MFRRIAAGGMDFDGVPLLPERCPTNRQDTPAAQCRNLTAMVKLGGDNFDWSASSEKHPQTIVFLRRPKGPCQCCYFPFAFSPTSLFEPANLMPKSIARLRTPAGVRFSRTAIAAEFSPDVRDSHASTRKLDSVGIAGMGCGAAPRWRALRWPRQGTI